MATNNKLHQVRNRAAAPVQITAEQILRESQNYAETKLTAPVQHIHNSTELAQYKTDKRTYYENKLRANSSAVSIWIKYAQFECKLQEFDRMRSIFERALDHDYTNISLWLAYALCEQKYQFINHARNIYDRAVTLLPMQNALWQKYTYYEEILDNIAGVRAIYERWMTFHPTIQYWLTYINFEIRNNHIDNARKLYERLTLDEKHNNIDTYIKWSKFELQHGTVQSARAVYERALIELEPSEAYSYKFLNTFAQFEIQQHEYERVRTIYKYALDKLDKQDSIALFNDYVTFEKQYGSISNIEYTVLHKKIIEYNELIELNLYDYDIWLDYIKMLIDTQYDSTTIINLFERALTYVPPIDTKQAYKRYIYLYIYYALYCETILNDINKAQQIYKRAIQATSSLKIHFVKLYMYSAKLEIRLYNIENARRILGTAIGICSNKSKVFTYYIELELQLGNIDRCRTLYEKQLSLYSNHSAIWLQYVQLEQTLQEYERVRALYQLVLQQHSIDHVSHIYIAYIHFEIEQQQYNTVRTLYQQYIERCGHTYTLYKQYIDFELNTIKSIEQARNIYMDADKHFKQHKLNNERAQLVHAWLVFEQQYGAPEQQSTVQSKQPTVVKKRREIRNDNNEIDGYEEYTDYVFSDDVDQKTSATMSLLMKAKQWKKKQEMMKQQNVQPNNNVQTNSEEINID